MGEAVPSVVVKMLTDYPELDISEIMIPFLTVDDAGYPNVCLLSRAQLDADSAHIYAVVSGSGTKANILRDRRATLVVFTTDVVYYCKLDAASVEEKHGLVCTIFTVASTKIDGDGSVPMVPPSYIPTDEIATFENWVDSRAILLNFKSTFDSQHEFYDVPSSNEGNPL